MSAGADLPSLLIMGTGMLEGYGPYISTQVDDLVSEDSSLIDVDGLMSDVRSTDDGDEGLRIIFETGAMTKGSLLTAWLYDCFVSKLLLPSPQ